MWPQRAEGQQADPCGEKAPAPLKGIRGPFLNSQDDGLEGLNTWPERVIC